MNNENLLVGCDRVGNDVCRHLHFFGARQSLYGIGAGGLVHGVNGHLVGMRVGRVHKVVVGGRENLVKVGVLEQRFLNLETLVA